MNSEIVNRPASTNARLAFTPREAAAMIAVSPRTLWSLTRSGEVRARKVGRLVRYYLPDLVAFMERNDGKHQH
jgi:excisionase family DNA binding protein